MHFDLTFSPLPDAAIIPCAQHPLNLFRLSGIFPGLGHSPDAHPERVPGDSRSMRGDRQCSTRYFGSRPWSPWSPWSMGHPLPRSPRIATKPALP